MDDKKRDDIFYVCTLIEFISRKTCNHRGEVIKVFDKQDISRQLSLAEVNHCLPFEQVAEEIIEEYHIQDGKFDTVGECKYTVPSFTAIGRVYQQLVLAICEDGDIEQAIMNVFSSFISDEISDFNSNVYYSNPDYLRCSFLDGKMLA